MLQRQGADAVALNMMSQTLVYGALTEPDK
jgi:hypothetical protein